MTRSMTATEAKNRFGEMLDLIKSEPVTIRKNGRDVAVVLTPEVFAELAKASAGPSPAVRALHEASAKRFARVYEALAK